MDLGSGTGILGLYLLKKGICERIVFVDMIEDAVINTLLNVRTNNVAHRSLVVNGIEHSSYLLENSFDLIVANPPYLPGEPRETYEYALLGGIHGFETILSFIHTSYRLLRRGGILYIVYSTLSSRGRVENELGKYFRITAKYSKKFFFEEIFVVRAEKI
jgi:release factor glutamine methyltransferase